EHTVAIAIEPEPHSLARRDTGVSHLLTRAVRLGTQLGVAQWRLAAAIALKRAAGGVQQIAAHRRAEGPPGDQIALLGAGLLDQIEGGLRTRDHQVEARSHDGAIRAGQRDLLTDDRRERGVEGEDELLEVMALTVREGEELRAQEVEDGGDAAVVE